MKFEIDSQTLEDLNILGKYKTNSIFSLFNKTVTRRGELLLERFFLNPYTDASLINEQSSKFSLFQTHNLTFPFSGEEMSRVEHYLESSDHKNILISFLHSSKRKLLQLIARDKEYGILEEGFSATVDFLKRIQVHITDMGNNPAVKSNPYYESVKKIFSILENRRLAWIFSLDKDEPITFLRFALYDHKVRYTLSDSLNKLLELMYEMDVMAAVSGVGKERGFHYAAACESGPASYIELKGVGHPAISNAVTNDLAIGNKLNVFFLTGANMAGKSTLMKSFGVSVYLAHMGFPVPARSMNFTVLQGLYTSINVPDDLSMGYSHFYAEVVRVKKIATAAASGKKFAIIFDELFKGTNVKDAYDATVTITDSFSKIKECIFIISTHIMEAGVTLRDSNNHMQFQYLPTVLDGNVPRYTYTLQQGISDERHGMRIVNNEKIIEIIKENT